MQDPRFMVRLVIVVPAAAAFRGWGSEILGGGVLDVPITEEGLKAAGVRQAGIGSALLYPWWEQRENEIEHGDHVRGDLDSRFREWAQG